MKNIVPTTILAESDTQKAWQWWISNIHPRPDLLPSNEYIFDQKRWDLQAPQPLLSNNMDCIKAISRLFLISQLGGENEIVTLSYGTPVKIEIFTS